MIQVKTINTSADHDKAVADFLNDNNISKEDIISINHLVQYHHFDDLREPLSQRTQIVYTTH